MKQLEPFIYKEKYGDEIKKTINIKLYKSIFEPLLNIISEKLGAVYNTNSSLINAILKGRIQYTDGVFSGKITSTISKQLKGAGAKFSRGKWRIASGMLPMEVGQAIGQSLSLFEDLNKELLRTLDYDSILEEVKSLDLDAQFERALANMDNDIPLASDLVGVIPKFTDEMRRIIAVEYSTNMNLYIKDWTEKSILKLRQVVEANAFDGYRAESLVEGIRKEYQVSLNKAKFLAGQETRLLMSQFREVRYKDAGVRKYRWSSSKDNRVRDRHKQLQGKVYFFDSPPITNIKTGARNNPGEDWNCRCIAIGLLD